MVVITFRFLNTSMPSLQTVAMAGWMRADAALDRVDGKSKPCHNFGDYALRNTGDKRGPVWNCARFLGTLALVLATILPPFNDALGAPSAATPPERLARGKSVFLKFCSGCHGFSGFSFYPPAPSFSMGDRMLKSDAELLRSILRGKNGMPSWENKLPTEWLADSLEYIRYMHKKSTTSGPVTNEPPEWIYVFPAYDGQKSLEWPIPFE